MSKIRLLSQKYSRILPNLTPPIHFKNAPLCWPSIPTTVFNQIFDISSTLRTKILVVNCIFFLFSSVICWIIEISWFLDKSIISSLIFSLKNSAPWLPPIISILNGCLISFFIFFFSFYIFFLNNGFITKILWLYFSGKFFNTSE